MFQDIFGQMKKTLGQLDKWLEAGIAYAGEKKIEQTVIASWRLAPDQFPFSRQVQIACDTAKLGISRLTGKDAPSHPDTETTLDELRTRVQSVIKYLDGFTADDFATTATREITQPRWEGKVMTGHDYFLEHVLPNFFFHATHTYALLRHIGVPIGKRDFLGPLSQRAPGK